MSQTASQKSPWTQPWLIRRATYLIVGAVLLVAAGFGLVDEGQIDTISASPVLGTIVAWIAAGKTHRGSDSPVTLADVRQAAPDPQVIANQVVSAIRAEETGTTAGAHRGSVPGDHV